MRVRSVSIAASALAIATLGALSGCSAAGLDGVNTEAITVATVRDTPSFNPPLSDSVTLYILQAVYEPLIRQGADGSYSPGLASEFGYTDPQTFELTVQEGVTFSDGAVLDAAAVVANLENGIATAGPQSSSFANVASVEAVDEDTVRIDLTAPDPSIPYALSRNLGLMASPDALDDTEALATTPIGSGPYLYVPGDSVTGDHYVFERNPDYWGDAEAYPFEEITFKEYADATSILNAMRAGTAQIGVGDTTTATAAQDAGLTVAGKEAATIALMLADANGTQTPALGDVRVRQALNYAVDREAITKAIVGEWGTPTSQEFGPQTGGYVEGLEYAYDPAKAKELLAEAGYPDGFSFSITIPPILPTFATALQGYFAEIGVDMAINAPDDFFTQVTNRVDSAYALQYTMADMFIATGPVATAGGLLNPYGLTDSEIDAAYATAASSSGEEQAAAYQAIGQRYFDLAWSVPVYNAVTPIYTTDGITVDVVPGESYPWLSTWKLTS